MAMLVTITCSHCGGVTRKNASHVNRSKRLGAPLFCDKVCFGWSRQKHKTDEQKRREKADYDASYRETNAERLREQKAEYHRRTYNAERAAVARKKLMPRHVEYCRSKEYRTYKSEYDKRYRAVKEFGPMAEAFLLLREIEDELAERSTKYERTYSTGRTNKSQRRKREYVSRLNGGRS